MLDAVFHQRLQQDAGHNDVECVWIKMLVDTQLVPAKADYFDIEIVIDKFDLFEKLNKLLMLAQQPTQDLGELQNQLTRTVGIKTHQRRNGIQRIKKKVRIDLALQRVQARFQQKPLLLFQLHLDARVVPNLDGNRDDRDYCGKPSKQGPWSRNKDSEQSFRPRIRQLNAAALQANHNHEPNSLPTT